MFTEGPLFKKYEKMIMELELNNFHLFPRLLNQKDLFKEYKKSDIYLSASISDGLSISLLEAFASKLYPIVSDITANSNIIEHGNNGLLFQTNDPVSAVTSYPYSRSVYLLEICILDIAVDGNVVDFTFFMR